VCLILIAHQAHPRYRMVVAANRDEWFHRASAPAAFWSDAPEVLAGRDLEQGGTWLGITRTARFAALTNFRDPSAHRESAPSRGALVSEFLRATETTEASFARIAHRAADYNGFNLVAWDGETLAVMSNRDGGARTLGSGVFGLSNHLLDTPWPKVRDGRQRLAALLAREVSVEALLELLDDTRMAEDHELPETGVGLDWERRLSPLRIVAGSYGTRCSTALLVDHAGAVTFAERTYGADGMPAGLVRERFAFDRAVVERP
jgi:uncharacterized protein with NRDE domain